METGDAANPYAAPVATGQGGDLTGTRVFTRPQVLLATFLGSFVAGLIMMHSNYARLALPRRKLVIAWMVGIPLLVGVCALPGRIFGLLLTIASMWALNTIYVQDIEGSRVLRAARLGRRSNWAVLGWVLAGLVIILLGGIGYGMAAAAMGHELPD